MDPTLQTLSQIAQSGGPVLLLAVLWIAYRAMRCAEKAVEAFNGMRADIAEIKVSIGKTSIGDEMHRIERKLDSIDEHMEENGAKLAKLVARAA